MALVLRQGAKPSRKGIQAREEPVTVFIVGTCIFPAHLVFQVCYVGHYHAVHLAVAQGLWDHVLREAREKDVLLNLHWSSVTYTYIGGHFSLAHI